MNDDIRIWEIDNKSNSATPVEATSRMEKENLLENVLAGNPELLMPGLTLVGRQTPTDGGNLDLLGVDSDGRLVVFELKREKLTRDAVAQVIDYCSWLNSLTEEDLAKHVAKHSDKHNLRKISNFASWYSEEWQGKQLGDLRPPKMVLVGLGADAKAHRMVEFLAAMGVDISLLTFHGYKNGDKMLLARQVDRGVEIRDVGPRKRTDADRRRTLVEWARQEGIEDLWRDAVEALSIASNGAVTNVGVTFYLPKITLPDNVNVSGSHSVVIDPPGAIRVTFYPGAVDVCGKKEFEDRKKEQKLPFEMQKPPNAPTTKRVAEQWYCRLDKTEWKRHKAALTALANDVHDAWRKRRLSGAVP